MNVRGCELQTYSDEVSWLAGRMPIIGASESPAIMGHGYADESAYSVWARKTGRLRDNKYSEELECGRVLQSGIIELFRRRFARERPDCAGPGFQVHSLGEFTVCRSLEHKFLGCTLDGIFEVEGGYAIVEAKNVSWFLYRNWKEEEENGYDDEEEEVTSEPNLPLKVMIQAQHQLATNPLFVKNYVVGLIGGNRLIWKEVVRNDRFINNALIPTLTDFAEMIRTDTPPPIDGSRATAKTIARLHPDDNGRTILLPMESVEWHEEYKRAKAEMRNADKRRMKYRNLIANAIGAATYGIVPAQREDGRLGQRYSYKTKEREPETKMVFYKGGKSRSLRESK